MKWIGRHRNRVGVESPAAAQPAAAAAAEAAQQPERPQPGHEEGLLERVLSVGRVLAIVAAGVALALWTLIVSLSPSLSIADIEVPTALKDKGITSSRVESILQQSLQKVLDGDLTAGQTCGGEPATVASGQVSPNKKVAKAKPSLITNSMDSPYLQVTGKALAILVPGQQQTLDLMLRLLAAKFKWAARQSFVTVNIVEMNAGKELDLQIVLQRSDAGVSVLRASGSTDQLLNPSSGLMRDSASKIAELADPVAYVNGIIEHDLEGCRRVGVGSLATIERLFEYLSPQDLVLILHRLRWTLLADSVPLDASQTRIDERAEALDTLTRIISRSVHAFPSAIWPPMQYEQAALPQDCAPLREEGSRLVEAWNIHPRDKDRQLDWLNRLQLICIWNSFGNDRSKDAADLWKNMRTVPGSAGDAMRFNFSVYLFSSFANNNLFEGWEAIVGAMAADFAGTDAGDMASYLLAASKADAGAEDAAARKAIQRARHASCLSGETRSTCADRTQDAAAFFIYLVGLTVGVEGGLGERQWELCSIAESIRPGWDFAISCAAEGAERSGQLGVASRGYQRAETVAERTESFAYRHGTTRANILTYRRARARVLEKMGSTVESEKLMNASRADYLSSKDILLWAAGRRCDMASIRRHANGDWKTTRAAKEAAIRMAISGGRYKEASRLIRQALAEDRSDPDAYALLGYVNLAQGFKHLAIDAFQRSLDLGLGDPGVQSALAIAKGAETAGAAGFDPGSLCRPPRGTGPVRF